MGQKIQKFAGQKSKTRENEIKQFDEKFYFSDAIDRISLGKFY